MLRDLTPCVATCVLIASLQVRTVSMTTLRTWLATARDLTSSTAGCSSPQPRALWGSLPRKLSNCWDFLIFQRHIWNSCLFASTGDICLLPHKIHSSEVQQRVRVSLVGILHRLAARPFLHGLHSFMDGLQDQHCTGNTQRGMQVFLMRLF